MTRFLVSSTQSVSLSPRFKKVSEIWKTETFYLLSQQCLKEKVHWWRENIVCLARLVWRCSGYETFLPNYFNFNLSFQLLSLVLSLWEYADQSKFECFEIQKIVQFVLLYSADVHRLSSRLSRLEPCSVWGASWSTDRPQEQLFSFLTPADLNCTSKNYRQ